MEKYMFGNDKNTIKILVIYDVENNKRRVQLAKLLEGYGKRVQYSAFECCINNIKYKKLLSQLEKMVSEDDNLRVYQLNRIPIVGRECCKEVVVDGFDFAMC